MKFRVVRYKPDSYELIPDIEYWFDSDMEADAFVTPLQAKGERGWRIQYWTPFLIYYATKKRSERGSHHETLESALSEAKNLKQDFRIVAWDEKTKAYKQIVKSEQHS